MERAPILGPAAPVCGCPMSQWPETPGDTHGSDLPDPWGEELVGLSADGLKLVEFVGGGAMGCVYRARKGGLHRQRAVKVLRSVDSEAEGLLHEAINHPNVVAVEDFGSLTDPLQRRRPYIVMEWLGEGAAMGEWVRYHRPTLDERLRLVEEAARGVAYANARGLLHHDIKPANILVDRFRTAKVADFGLAQLLIESGQGQSGGTRAYQSPEQCVLPSSELEATSDVYALGATLFSVLTDGALPVELSTGTSGPEAYKAKTEQQPRLSLLPPETPPAVRAIIKRALHPDPKHRYESASEFANAIAQARSRERSPLGRLRGWTSRCCASRPRLAAWVVGMAAGLLLAFVLSFPLRAIRPLEHWYLGQLPALDAASVSQFDEVRIVHMPTPTEMAALADELGVEQVLASPTRTWRPMHGAFVDAMSEAGASVIAFDLYFPQPWPELDAPFAAAIARSTERGTPVVIGAAGWFVDAADRPAMPEAYALAGARWGSLTLDLSATLPLIPLVAEPPLAEGLPSFALTTLAARIQPRARFSAWIQENGVRVRFWRPVEPTGQRMRTGTEVLLPVVGRQLAAEVPERFRAGRQADWTMAYTQRAVFTIESLDAARLDYARLLRDDPAERARKVGGRILVVVDPSHDEKFEVGLERELLGGEIHAGAVQSLLAERTSRWMADWMTLLLAVAVVAVAAAVGVCGHGPGSGPAVRWLLRAMRLALLALCIVGVVAGLLLLYARFGLITLPIFWLVAVVASCLAAWMAHRFLAGRAPRVAA